MTRRQGRDAPVYLRRGVALVIRGPHAGTVLADQTLRIQNLPSSAFREALAALARGNVGAYRRALRACGLPAQRASVFLSTLATAKALRSAPESLALVASREVRRWVPAPIRARTRVRVGLLLAADSTFGGNLLQLRLTGWRLGMGARVCRECALLWESQASPDPSCVSEIANAPDRGGFISLSDGDLALMKAAIEQALADAPPQGWIEGEWGSPRWRRVAQAPASQCEKGHPREPARLPRRRTGTLVAAQRALARLQAGVIVRELPQSYAYRGLGRTAVQCTVAFRDPSTRHVRTALSVSVGSGTSRAQRLLTAWVEAVERVSSRRARPDLRRVRARDLGRDCLMPSQIPLYAGWQYRTKGFRYKRASDHAPIDWMSSIDMHSGRRVWVPAFLTPAVGVAGVYARQTSNGVCTHLDLRRATVGALLEVIERDAIFVSWCGGVGGRELPPQLLTAPLQKARRELARAGWGLRLAWLQGRGGYHVIAAVGRRLRKGAVLARGASVVGWGSGGAWEGAALHALRELLMGLETEGEFLPAHYASAPPPFHKIWVMKHPSSVHTLYLYPSMGPALELLFKGTPLARRPRDVSERLPVIIDRLGAEGLRVLRVDLTDPQARPFHTVQTLILGTQQPAWGMSELRFGSGLIPSGPPARFPAVPEAPFRPTHRNEVNPFPPPLA